MVTLPYKMVGLQRSQIAEVLYYAKRHSLIPHFSSPIKSIARIFFY